MRLRAAVAERAVQLRAVVAERAVRPREASQERGQPEVALAAEPFAWERQAVRRVPRVARAGRQGRPSVQRAPQVAQAERQVCRGLAPMQSDCPARRPKTRVQALQ